MDHLPRPSKSSTLPTPVPCLCSPTSYDNLPFVTFPSRKGWTLIPPSYGTSLTRPSTTAANQPPTSTDAAAFLQSWLFFGLLAAVLDVVSIPLNPHDLVRADPTYPSNLLITTTRLPEYLREWVTRSSARSLQQQKVDFRVIQELIMQATAFTRANFTDAELADWLVRPEQKWIVPLSVEVSILALAETLDWTSRVVRGFAYRPEAVDLSAALTRRLVEVGWCPSEVAMMALSLGNSGMWVAGSLGRVRVGAGGDHQGCGRTKCVLSFVDEATYEPKHTEGCAGCEFVGVDSEAVTRILDSGGLPSVCITNVLRADGDDTSGIKVTVVASQPYIAISHVWVGGLGNTRSNSLPTCQLLQLRDMAAALSNGGTIPALWIDTLCVPLEIRGRKLALVRLVETYRAAERVLVLDEDLRQTTLSCTLEEKVLRICLSSWMRRLWTLEEGLIGREKLNFQFLEGAVSFPGPFDDICHSVGNGALEVLRRYLPEQEREHVKTVSGTTSKNTDRGVAPLLMALLYRSTTKVSDEPICLSHLLDLDVSDIVSLKSTQERMVKFLSILSARGVPMSTRFLFTQESKLQLPGFRWAPRSFMDLSPEDTGYILDDLRDNKGTAFTADGLRVPNGSGVLLKFGEEVMKKVIFFKRDLAWHVAVPVPLTERLSRSGRFWDTDEREKALNVEPFRDWNEALKTIYGSVPSDLAIIYDGLMTTSHGVLVSTYRQDPTEMLNSQQIVLYGSIIGQLKILELRTKDHNHIVSNLDYDTLKFSNRDYPFQEMKEQMQEAFTREFRPGSCVRVECVPLKKSLEWCVG